MQFRPRLRKFEQEFYFHKPQWPGIWAPSYHKQHTFLSPPWKEQKAHRSWLREEVVRC